MRFYAPHMSGYSPSERAFSAQQFLGVDPESEKASVTWADHYPRINPKWRGIDPPLWTATSSLASGSGIVVDRSLILSSAGESIGITGRSMDIFLVTLPDPIELAKAKLAAAKAKQFKPEGKDERVKKALAALSAALVDSKLDADTWRWIAEDADVEYMEDGSE